MLKGKTVVLAISGSIAAYKMANVARMLLKQHCDVEVLMTQNATQFINPITFESLTGHKCLVDTFDRNFQYSVEHVALAKRADVVLVAPASANVIGKIANGIADDMLTTTVMACPCKKIVSPAMNHNMYHNPIVQDNIEKLKHFGYEIITPATGMLANGDIGDGRMPEESVLFEAVVKEIACEKDLAGKKVLISAGATREPIDPVRYVGNRSSGKMGYSIAQAAAERGAEVTLVTGPSALTPPPNIKVVNVETTQQMMDACLAVYDGCDIVIKAAAVADYRPHDVAAQKIKKKTDDALTVVMDKNPDILKTLGERKKGQFLVGFAAETQNLIDNAKEKVTKKNLDMIVANDVTMQGAGFGSETNIVKLIFPDGSIKELPQMSKYDVAEELLNTVLRLRK